jgi:hypothetical protein
MFSSFSYNIDLHPLDNTRSAWNELGKRIMETFKALIASAYLIRIIITLNLSYCFQELAAIN